MDESLAARLQEVLDPTCADRDTKLQSVCADAWARLEEDPPPATKIVDDLVTLLREEDNLLLVSLRIPELRPNEDPPQHLLQKKVLRDVARVLDNVKCLCLITQDDIDAEYTGYSAEKRIFQQAELYRASLLLLNSGAVPADKIGRVKAWIEAAPFTLTTDTANDLKGR